ncbi:MAG: Lrp/AsnC family transcriptional regulator [Candidatus Bathyarchaeota archaeon]|nr:Lrp/AsnC family transcriptional regulator [Candidatus Bathyarchaeota archaeon]MDH5495260.1 Lrp/AsnC family transcriptional regulator [Candidatus Bathyarchaeota archaeon]
MSLFDALDMKIIRVLQTNARKPIVQIAKEVNANEATVRRRIDKLLKNGVIERFTVVLDYHKLGRVIKAFIGLRVEPAKLKAIAEHLAKHPDTQVVYRTSGDTDIVTEVIFEKMEDLNAFLEEELKLEGILGTIVTIVIGPYKRCPWTGL